MHMAKQTTVTKTTRTKSAQEPRIAKVAKVEAKAPKSVRRGKAATSGKLSALAAAHQVLATSREAMTAPELIAAMADQRLWTSPNGKTPANTLYAAILREINTKGGQARFRKTGRGKFAAAG
jgi:phage I-like protein